MTMLAAQKAGKRRLYHKALNNPEYFLRQSKTQGANELAPPSLLPAAPGGPQPPSDVMGMMQAQMGQPGGMPPLTKLQSFRNSMLKGADVSTDDPETKGVSAKRAAAYRFGFFRKIAELGLKPSDIEAVFLTKEAGMASDIARGIYREGRGFFGGLTSGALDLAKSLGTLAVATPFVAAPIAGAMLGIGGYHLLKPKYEEPEDIHHAEQVALYKRLTRQARMKARATRLKRLARTRKDDMGEAISRAQEEEIEVPRVGAA
jgi:hypothetical protein